MYTERTSRRWGLMGASLGINRAPRAPSKQEIEWEPGEENTHSDICIARIFINRVQHNEPRDGGENSRGPRVTRDPITSVGGGTSVGVETIASAKDEQGSRRETEK